MTHNADLVKVTRVVRKVSKERRDNGEVEDKERNIEFSSLSCIMKGQLSKQSRRQGAIKTSYMGSKFQERGLETDSTFHVVQNQAPIIGKSSQKTADSLTKE